MAHVGDAGQLQYNPFENPQRAASEEFGDLLAEGLYALFNEGYGLHRATRSYWEEFIGVRRGFIERIGARLTNEETHGRVQAMKSLREARFQLADVIRPTDCVDFLDAWQRDRRHFAEVSRAPSRHPCGYEEAFATLGVSRWQEARFGVARMPTPASVMPLGTRR